MDLEKLNVIYGLQNVKTECISDEVYLSGTVDAILQFEFTVRLL